jgi:hypothetical protein
MKLVKAALAVRGVLGHVGGRAAVFTAQRQALQHAQGDQDDRRGDADAGVVGQHADQKGRQAHDQDGDQEGVLAADAVAEAPNKAAPNGRTKKPAARPAGRR